MPCGIVNLRFFILLLILRKRTMNDTQNIQLYVGENIKKIRLARGLSLEDVADKIYKSKSTISKYEKGTSLESRKRSVIKSISIFVIGAGPLRKFTISFPISGATA